MEKLSVLKVGGKVLEDPKESALVLSNFAQLPGLKIMVHGGGKTASQLAKRMDIPVQMIDGRRITDAAMLEIVLMVYGGLMNKSVVALLQARGINAIGLTGADMNVIQAHKRPVGQIDFGFVGDVDGVDAQALQTLLQAGMVPVMAPLTHDGAGQMLNTNADTIASSVAQAMAEQYEVHLVFCFDRPGVLTDPTDDSSLIPQITPAAYAQHKKAGRIAGGMLPKLDNAFAALNQGVHRIYLCQPQAVAQLGQADFVGTTLMPA
ncbi:MAG: acetylglutamate kinase [Bacteroidota bacterium]